ncbi:ATP-binding cassette domain-containing protein [Limnohabitans sp. Hippo3]|uniref:ATP-binding cassette domain-containing protein n=1 Tax=Limnohabitans sp. Hippo3 TaxID=1597956 RepID=UPI000D36E351|nr:ATP-binding cassette domain-containing protein [Limnohabitans sp. Hippo3]PUE38422.1 peptide ABC transporter ATP-binding protein [Limnohabitans sp. Hippo3]
MNAMSISAPLLQVKHLGRRFALPRTSLFQPAGALQALSDVSFTLQPGKSLGVVGESGSGKSTLARLVMALDTPTEGQVVFKGVDVHQTHGPALRQLRSGFQMVFQDPYGSLDPRQKVLAIVTEPIKTLVEPADGRTELRDRAAQALSEVGLRSADLDKYPHEFSGGQRQRIAIARALITRPALIVADEPVSALDVSVQAQVLNLMMDLQDRYGLSYLFVSHDLAVVNLMCDDVLVLQLGRVVEQGPVEQIFKQAEHPYTRKLLAAIPGQPPSFLTQETP